MKHSSFVTLFVLVLSSCGQGVDPGSPPVFTRESNTSCLAPESQIVEDSGYSFEPAFNNLPSGGDSLRYTPVAMEQFPNSGGRWIAAILEGELVTFENDQITETAQSVLDIRSRVHRQTEAGLTGVAIHPDYPSDNRIFVVYNDADNNTNSTLSSFTINTSSFVADPNSEQVLLTLSQPQDRHQGGSVGFGKDGYLYIGFGDGGFKYEAQNLRTLYGSMLRIDVSVTPYQIPDDNPFNTNQTMCNVAGVRENLESDPACPEIYAYGLRNPWRWSFDSLTGELWVGDVGESDAEEVNRVESSLDSESSRNYGWPTMEGSCVESDYDADGNRASECTVVDGLELPITQYKTPSSGGSVMAGFVYRGTDIPELNGYFVFGDFLSRQLMAVPSGASPGSPFITLNSNLSRPSPLVGFAEDESGDILAISFNARFGTDSFRLTSSGTTSVALMPENLSDTGCFDVATKTFPSGVVPYSNNSRLWSDGAKKERAFAIPDDTNIEVDSNGDFIFPEGSILIKSFLSGEQYLETRLMINFESGWQGYSYHWNDDETEAALVEGDQPVILPDAISFSFTNPDNGQNLTTSHTIPSRAQCFQCHTAAANFSLGLEAIQQNYYDTSLDVNFLGYLNDTYLASSLDPTNPEYNPLYKVDNTLASFEEKARSYLHSNCSSCHRPGSIAPFMDLRYTNTTSLADMNVCNVDANVNLGNPSAKRLVPGEPNNSMLLSRMKATDENRMPPLATAIVDEDATALVEAWINSLTSCND